MGLVEKWGDNAFGWFFANLIEAYYNIGYAIYHRELWLDWLTWSNTVEDKQSLMRFVYYGASIELLFAAFAIVLLITVVGFIWNRFMWRCVRVLEGFANGLGRLVAWVALIMVLQQIIIIFMQRVFAVSEISLGFGFAFTKDVSWWSEELKLYNAMIVTLCATYTFVQGGHVRVDLIYSIIGRRAKKIVDMFGSIVFMLPAAILTWTYGWFFMWRNLMTPPVSASNTLEKLMKKATVVRWKVETIGFSPNGFNAYILFKVLLVTFTFLVMLQAIAFFYRSYLEFKEGPEAEGRYLDKDKLGDATAELAAEIH